MCRQIAVLSLAAAFLISTSAVLATDRLVPSVYPTIQAAIDAAANGDAVIIASGTYTGAGNRDLDFGGKAITIRSTNPEDPRVVAATIIDCSGSTADPHRGFYFHSGEGPSSIVAGLTIMNGYVKNDNGGGILCDGSSPTIQMCVITNNQARGHGYYHDRYHSEAPSVWGGAISCSENSNPTLVDCAITYNQAAGANSPWSFAVVVPPGGNGYGGALSCTSDSGAEIINCVISNNTALGGLGADGACIGLEQTNSSAGGEAHGGGIYAGSGTGLTVKNCLVARNEVRGGDGGANYGCSAGSGGDVYGGGICSSLASNASISNTTVTGNLAGAGSGVNGELGPDGPDGDEYGAGMYCGGGSVVAVTNSILWDNVGDDVDGSGYTATYSCIGQIIPGLGNISADPYFVDANNGDYHLLESSLLGCSPCINGGDPAYIPAPEETDIDGDPRVMGGRIDMGADETALGPIPRIEVLPLQLSFTAELGSPNPTPQILSIRNSGSGTLNWDITEDCDWLSVSPSSGESTGEVDNVTVTVDLTGLGSGEYNCALFIVDSSAGYSPQVVPVSFNVERPEIEVTPTQFLFGAQSNGANPDPQILSIRNSGTGTLNWEITEDCDWFLVTPTFGESTEEADNVTVSVDTSSLPEGQYDCVLTVSDAIAANNPQLIPITLILHAAGILHVPGEYPTIQSAIDASVNGDTIMLSPMTYMGPGNHDLDFGGRAITVTSTNSDDPCVVAATVIDCENSGRGFYFHSGEGRDSVVAGLTITRGKIVDMAAKGGAILCDGASPTIMNCIITGNKACCVIFSGGSALGGGIYCTSNSNPRIAKCTISNNSAEGGMGDGPGPGGGDGYGGGIHVGSSSHPTIEDCDIFGNAATGGEGGPASYDDASDAGNGCGGGIWCNSTLTIKNCRISSNTAMGGTGGNSLHESETNGGTGNGGGIFCGLQGTVAMNNCVITSNEAVGGKWACCSHWGEGYGGDGYGGGIYCDSADELTTQNCTIAHNTVKGGGAPDLADSSCDDTGCWPQEGNTGGCYGAGMYCGPGSSATVTDCILWGNDVDDVNGSGYTVTYSCVEQIIAGTGNIHADPCFVSGAEGDYYLSQIAAGQAVDSPCVDAGSDFAAYLGMAESTTRTDEVNDVGIVDMGYHYYMPMPVSADIDGDWDVDFADYALFAAEWHCRDVNTIARGNVLVDGNLSEWSNDVGWIALDKVYYMDPNDINQAMFALQYNPDVNKVYVAVVVQDTDHVFSDEYVYWDASDRLEIYSQGDAEGGSGWVGIYDVAQQYYVAPNTAGGSWATWAMGETLATDVGLEYAVAVEGDQIIYEVGVRMFDNYGGFSGSPTIVTNLSPGQVVGFDIVVNTRWGADGFGMLSANLMTGKSGNADQFARYLLIDESPGPLCNDPIADLDGNRVVNFADLRFLCESWLWEKRY